MFLLLATHLLFASTPLVEVATVCAPEVQRLILVRHGECDLNLPDPNGMTYVSGRSNHIPLTPKGEAQARALASKLAAKICKGESLVVCSSTALRAHTTALCLIEELAKQFPCIFGKSAEGLCELGHGKWEGVPKDEAYLREMRRWEDLSAKEKLSAPKMEGGESYKDVAKRALPALQEIVDSYRGKTILVVSHFMAMNALVLHWSEAESQLSLEPKSKLPHVIFGNCDLLIVDIPAGCSIDQAHIVQHLKS